MEFLNEFYNNTILDYSNTFILFLSSVFVLYLFKHFIIKLITRWANITANKLDDAIIRVVKSIKWPFYVLFPFYLSSTTLTLPATLELGLYYIFWPITLYYIIQITHNVVIFILEGNAKKNKKDIAVIGLFSILIRSVLWFIAIALMLANLGYDITSLLAGLGIGGIAIALAVQNVLSDIFSAFSIYLDKPFAVGDMIKIGADMGTVEKIGIKSTRIKTLQGEELVVSNKELTTVRIQNFKKLQRRRSQFFIGVRYDTPIDKLEKISEIFQKICGNIDIIEFDRASLIELTSNSLKYEMIFYINSKKYTDYAFAQQKINLSLLKEFKKEGIEFAFPTRTINLER